MKQFDLVGGKMLAEMYSLGFTGSHFQFIVSGDTWLQIVEMIGQKTPFASRQKSDYVAPTDLETLWGFNGCASISRTIDGMLAINIPAIPSIDAGANIWREIKASAGTVEVLTWVLRFLLDDEVENDCKNSTPQLFHVETFMGKPGEFHAAGIDLSVSFVARKYLHSLGENVHWEDIVHSMNQYDKALLRSKDDDGSCSYSFSVFRAELRERGLLHFCTRGNCACLGASPNSFSEEEGCYLSSHNVDNVIQQFSLLIAIAAVWQKVRNGIRVE